MTRGYLQIHDGEWMEPSRKGFVDQCCDCALVHIVDYAVIDRTTRLPLKNAVVQFKVRRDNRKTAASRRKLKFEKDT